MTTSFATALTDRIRQSAHKDLTFYQDKHTSLGFDVLVELAAGLSSAMPKKQAGDRVVIAAASKRLYATSTIAAMMNGLTPLLLPGSLDEGAVIAQAETAGATAIIRGDHEAARLYTRQRKSLFVKERVFRPTARLDRRPDTHWSPASAPDHPSAVIFTSGSTGTPKGVVWSQSAIMAHLETYRKTLGYTEGARLCNPLVMHHSDGFFHGPLMAAWCGLEWLCPPKFAFDKLDEYADLMTAYTPDTFISVPSLLRMLQKGASDRLITAMRTLRQIISSAEPLPPTLAAHVSETIAPIVNIYGLSETVNGGIFRFGNDGSPEGSVGYPIDLQVAVGTDDGPLDGATEGRLYLRGPSLFDGYEIDGRFEADTRIDGWFQTSDVARILDDGAIEILGRQDDGRNLRGVLIQPSHIERTVMCHPDITGAAAFFIGDEDDLTLVCVAESTTMTDTGALREWLSTRLATGMVPSKIKLRAQLPLNDRMKVDKLALKADYSRPSDSTDQQKGGAPLEEQVRHLMAQVLDIDPARLAAGATVNETPGWDSFGHINLVLAIEKAFRVQFSYADVTETRTLAAIVTLLQERGATQTR